MNAKEKAHELIDAFENIDDCDKHYYDHRSPCSHQAKQCAIICVKQIVQVLGRGDDPEHAEYWQEVLNYLNEL